MAQVKNISTGPRGAYLNGVLTMVEVGQTAEADDFADEWFEEIDPLDHDENGKKGGSKPRRAAETE